jgi:hypothetical protein
MYHIEIIQSLKTVKMHMMKTQHFDNKTFNTSVTTPVCLKPSLRRSQKI